MELGDRIRVLRTQNRLSQGELAKALESATSTISEIERGERAPRVELLLKVADFFGVSTDYLLGRGKEDLIVELKGSIDEVKALKKGYEEKTAEVNTMVRRLSSLKPPDEIPIELLGEVPEVVDDDTRARIEEKLGLRVRESSLDEEYVNAIFWFLLTIEKMEEKGWRLSKKGVPEEGEAETGNG